MDWKTLLSTFGLIFVAEMGDKTQLAVISLSAKSKAPWAVFLGSALALTLVSMLGALLGGVLTRYVSEAVIGKIAGAAFVVMGLWMLFAKR